MKRTRNRRRRYQWILERLRPESKPIFYVEADEILADLDPGLAAWRNARVISTAP